MGDVVSFGSIVGVPLDEDTKAALAVEADRRGVRLEKLASELIGSELAERSQDERESREA